MSENMGVEHPSKGGKLLLFSPQKWNGDPFEDSSAGIEVEVYSDSQPDDGGHSMDSNTQISVRSECRNDLVAEAESHHTNATTTAAISSSDVVQQFSDTFALTADNFQDINKEPENFQDIKQEPENFQDIKQEPENFQEVEKEPENFQDIKKEVKSCDGSADEFGTHPAHQDESQPTNILLNVEFKVESDVDMPDSTIVVQELKHELPEGESLDGAYEEVKTQSIDQSDLPYLCTVCGQQYPQREDLEKHLNDHLDLLRVDEPSKSTCPKCPGRIFLNLKLHQSHHRMGLECDVCGQAFHAAISLAEHRIQAHPREKKPKCTDCRKSFKSAADLKRHNYHHHAEREVRGKIISCGPRGCSVQYYYVCPHCKHKDRTLKLHEAHLRIHDDERPYPCEQCDKRFTTSDLLKTHTQSIHQETRNSEEEKKFKKKQDSKSGEAARANNEPFMCDECGARFIEKQNLKDHTLRHRGERPHKCLKCGYSSPSKSGLFNHVKKYHLENFFECKQKKCTKWYWKKERLLAHIEKEHKVGLATGSQKSQ